MILKEAKIAEFIKQGYVFHLDASSMTCEMLEKFFERFTDMFKEAGVRIEVPFECCDEISAMRTMVGSANAYWRSAGEDAMNASVLLLKHGRVINRVSYELCVGSVQEPQAKRKRKRFDDFRLDERRPVERGIENAIVMSDDGTGHVVISNDEGLLEAMNHLGDLLHESVHICSVDGDGNLQLSQAQVVGMAEAMEMIEEAKM